MPSPNNPIRIDPFFDGEGGPQRQIQLPGYADDPGGAGQQGVMSGNVVGGTTAAASHREGYHDVGGNYTEGGRPMAAVMRGGVAGLRGTIIPRSGLGGIPIGAQPHVTAGLVTYFVS